MGNIRYSVLIRTFNSEKTLPGTLSSLGKQTLLPSDKKYVEAETCFAKCLSYQFMPEPILGMTLGKLYSGDADTALEWITKPIAAVLEEHGAADPDPIEWAYLVISLLCQGQIEEATRRAHQFLFLRHRELARCRWAVDALNGIATGGAIENLSTTMARSRASVHQLPERDMVAWVNELCRMLTACGQGGFAEQLQSALSGGDAQAASFPVARASNSTNARKRDRILLLTLKPFIDIAPRYLPSKIRAALRLVTSALLSFWEPAHQIAINRDEFALAVHSHARDDNTHSALILGARFSSIYTRTFFRSHISKPFIIDGFLSRVF
jgi:hypothetical protein